MAERNVAARPYGESKLLLAEAQLKAGRTREAKVTIDAVLASDWRTAEVRRVATLVDRAMGSSGD